MIRSTIAKALKGAVQRIGGTQIISGYNRALPRRGTRELLAAYRESPILRAVVQKISYMVAAQEWWAEVEQGEKARRIDGHPLTDLLMNGNPYMDGLRLRMACQTSLDLVGEAFAILDRNGVGAPVQAWYIPAHWVRTVAQPGHDVFEIMAPHGAPPVALPREDVLWLRDADPERPYERGAGLAGALGDELNADEYAAKHVAASLANRARPDVIISGTENAPFKEPEVKRIEQVWRQRFTGPRNVGRPFFSSGPINVTTMGQTFRDLDLTNLRGYERDIIVTVFGMPPEMLGILANSNRATIDSADHFMGAYVLDPRLRAWRSAINHQLSPQYDARIRAQYESPIRADKEHTRAVMTAAPWAFEIDEHRAAAGHDPLADGSGRQFPHPINLGFRPPGRPRAAKGQIQTKSPDDVPDGFDDAPLGKALAEVMREAIEGFAADILGDIGVNIVFDLFDDRVGDFLNRNALSRARQINDTTRTALRSTLADGTAAGESTGKLVARIRSVFTDATTRRAKVIARTEIVRASNFGATEAMRQAGIEKRQWLSTDDTHTRETHVDLDGQIRGIDEPFESPTGATAMYPGDFGIAAEDVNCRCAAVPVFEFEGKGHRATYWKFFDGRRGRFEDAAETALRDIFRAQERAAIAAL